jgi:hypothetical protein
MTLLRSNALNHSGDYTMLLKKSGHCVLPQQKTPAILIGQPAL